MGCIRCNIHLHSFTFLPSSLWQIADVKGVAGNEHDRRAERGCQLVEPLLVLNTLHSGLMLSPNLHDSCCGMQQYRQYRDYVYIGYITVMP